MRCGSTTLHRILSAHPDIFMPEQKELHFFDGYNPELGQNLAAYKALFSDATKHQLCGEVTPDYLTTPGAFEHIAETFEQLKVIVILREPVARLYSHYMMSIAAGFEVLSFEQAINSESLRLQQRDKIADIFHSYIERSTYLPMLKRYAERFGKHNLCVLFLEELSAEPKKSLTSLWDFLGVTNLSADQLGNVMQATNKQEEMMLHKKRLSPLKLMLKKCGLQGLLLDKTVMTNERKRRLESHFKDHNQSLSNYLNRSLPW